MAKANFHKSQRVFVRPVGTFAHVEAVVPKWVKDCDEPIKISYDCGMGREFAQEELCRKSRARCRSMARDGIDGTWRIIRGLNRWKSADQCGHHPYPGTHPTVVTSDRDWGGWRVPGSEYDLDPFRVERQAQIIVRAPVFLEVARGVRAARRARAGEPERRPHQARPARPPRDLRDGRVAFSPKQERFLMPGRSAGHPRISVVPHPRRGWPGQARP